MTPKPARLLIIAGSDSSGGAGIQADIKTATAFGVYAMTAVTAVTAQDTRGVHAIHLIPASIVRDQIACVLDDIGADAIKIGMLGTAEIVETVADVLKEKAQGIPLVLDPVLASSSGARLLDEKGTALLRDRLFPLASLVTPNIPEAEILSGHSIHSPDDAMQAAKLLCAAGARAVLVKGGHGQGADVIDTLIESGSLEPRHFKSPRIDTPHTHGTGCTFATAIAAGLAQGLSLTAAVERAHQFVHEAIRTAPGFGSGHGPLNHLQRS